MADYTDGAYFGDVDYYSEYPDAHYFCIGEQAPTFLEELKPHYPCDISIGLEHIIPGGIMLYYPTKASATDSVALEGRWLPLKPSDKFRQKVMQSAGGEFSIYDSGFTDRIYEMYLGDLVPEATRERLYILLRNICRGMLRPLQVQDETGILYTMRFMDNVDWAFVHWLKWNITLHFYVEDVTCE